MIFSVLDGFFRFSKKSGFGVFLVHPPMASVLLSASVKRCFVSRMREFYPILKKESTVLVLLLRTLASEAKYVFCYCKISFPWQYKVLRVDGASHWIICDRTPDVKSTGEGSNQWAALKTDLRGIGHSRTKPNQTTVSYSSSSRGGGPCILCLKTNLFNWQN